MTNELSILRKVLNSILKGDTSTKELQKKFQDYEVMNCIVELEKLGFIARDDSKPQKHLSQAFWKVTDKGNFFLQVFDSLVGEEFSVVMTIPPKFSNEIQKRFNFVKQTEKVFKEIVGDSTKEIKIFSPYIDATLISVLEKVKPNVSIKIVTVPVKYAHGQNPLIERLKTQKKISVKYLNEEENGTQIFQLHAKVFIIDSKKMYIGSANIKETSIFYNLETGLLVQNEDVIKKYEEIFDYFYEVA